jgi:serine/threonine-protein kinase HipA
MKARQATVRLDGQPVGMLSEEGKQITFRYSPEWLANSKAVPVSLTLPLSEKPYVTDGLHTFFENLLPEGWLLDLTTTAFKISKDDAFGLLIATCADCIGAVEVLPIVEEPA